MAAPLYVADDDCRRWSYLHISGAGPLLASGFWLIASERFDPRTAKKRFGQMAGAGTLGGLLSALLAERIAAVFGVPAMLPLLAAAAVRQRVAGATAGGGHDRDGRKSRRRRASATTPAAARSGLRVIAEAPYLRHLAALVLLGTTGAALVDYLFKVAGGRRRSAAAIICCASSRSTTPARASSRSSSRRRRAALVLERFGLGVTTSTPSLALLVGSLAGLVAPGFGSLVVARGGESVFRSSLFRAGYELFYTPIPAAEKRAAKSLIDVAFDRLGDAVGGGLVRLTHRAAARRCSRRPFSRSPSPAPRAPSSPRAG